MRPRLTCVCVIQVRYDLGGIYFQQGCTDQGAYGKAMEHFRQTRDLLQKVGHQNPFKRISILSYLLCCCCGSNPSPSIHVLGLFHTVDLQNFSCWKILETDSGYLKGNTPCISEFRKYLLIVYCGCGFSLAPPSMSTWMRSDWPATGMPAGRSQEPWAPPTPRQRPTARSTASSGHTTTR